MEPWSSGYLMFCIKYFSSIHSGCEFWNSIHLPCTLTHTHVLGQSFLVNHVDENQGAENYALGNFSSAERISFLSWVCASADLQQIKSWQVITVRIVVLMPSGVSFFILLHIGEALVQAFLLFFSKCRKKVFILIIKISLFCILQYISNISTMKHSWVQHGQEVDNIFQRRKLPGMRLGGAAGTATLYHLLYLVHKRGPISAFERVFPPLAPQRSAALPTCTAPSAFQPRHLLGRLASSVALLLLVIISYPFPSTRDF